MNYRTDANHKQIVQSLRDIGATVQSLANVGAGCPDILVGFRGANYLIEIKRPGKRLRQNQRDWHNNWRGEVTTVRSIDEALRVVGAIL
jgi:hypothetical protein